MTANTIVVTYKQKLDKTVSKLELIPLLGDLGFGVELFGLLVVVGI